MPIDATKLETNEKSLILVDSLNHYIDNNGSALVTKSLLNGIQHFVKYTNDLEKNGVSILGDMGAFLFKNQIQSLVDYELNLPPRFDMNLKGVCIYHQKDFDRLSEDSQKKIIEHRTFAGKI